jgi:hypothetical protein
MSENSKLKGLKCHYYIKKKNRQVHIISLFDTFAKALPQNVVIVFVVRT